VSPLTPRPRSPLVQVAREPLLAAVRSAQRKVFIAAPFVSGDVAAALAKGALASTASERRFLTALTEGSVRSGFLNPRGLRKLMDSGFQIASIPNLHAKVALVDNRWGLVGSGNLTNSGLGGRKTANVELGVGLTRSQIQEGWRIAEAWWDAASPVTAADLAPYEQMARARGDRRRSGRRHGREFPAPEGTEVEDIRRRRSTGLWLKMMYHDTRRNRREWWRNRRWISDGRPPPSDDHLVGGPRYAVGDLLVFYLVERGGPVRCCPAIAEVRGPTRYDPAYVGAHGRPGDADQWPWVTEVRVLHSTSLQDAPTLSDVGVSPSSVRRQGHIKLSESQFAAARDRILAIGSS
jgi:hypothetical protein